MYFVQGALNQCEWRVTELWNLLFKTCLGTMEESYQNLRERIGSSIATIVWFDLTQLYIDPRVPKKFHPMKIQDAMGQISAKVRFHPLTKQLVNFSVQMRAPLVTTIVRESKLQHLYWAIIRAAGILPIFPFVITF